MHVAATAACWAPVPRLVCCSAAGMQRAAVLSLGSGCTLGGCTLLALLLAPPDGFWHAALQKVLSVRARAHTTSMP
jgi:hypothetical protein